MKRAEWQDDEISLLAISATLIRHRWRIVRWMLFGGLVAGLLAFLRPPVYTAFASFIPQGTDLGRSGLASLAGQFGVSLPAGNQSLSPDFYADLLKSRVLLQNVAHDTLTVAEMGGKRVLFLDLFEIPAGPASRREEEGVRLLRQIVSTSVVKSTGVVQLQAGTRWPSVSLAIVNDLVKGVNEFNQQTRQGQAASERKFVEGRLAVAASDLRAAEDRLEEFLRNNRAIGTSPDLMFQRDRLQRDVALQQNVFTSLTQSYEEVRIREVRDTPVITIIEPPAVATLPEPRKRLLRVLLGLMVGALIGSILSFTSEGINRRRNQGDREADQFVGSLSEVKGEMLGGVRWLKRRVGR